MEIDVCSWSPLLFYPITLSSGILPVFLLASLNLSIYQSISQVSNICSQHQPFHCWNSQLCPFELNHLLTLNIAQATQLHNSISSAHRYVFKAICEVCEFYFKHWQLQWLGFVYRVTLLDCRFCFEKNIHVCFEFFSEFLERTQNNFSKCFSTTHEVCVFT